MKIESKDTDIQSLLNSNYFHIPRFQRPYSWDEENINDFWNDIVDNGVDDYFIGSMVVFKKAKQQYGVVDGQQRLTTITILLCVLRDCFTDLECKNQAAGIHQLIERKDLDNKNEYVLKTETSFPYFQEFIQKHNDDPDVEVAIKNEEQSLKVAHERFNRLVDDVINSIDSNPAIAKRNKAKCKIDKLTEIRDSVLSLNIIFIILDNEDDAYLIFETLNTRGKDLALTDLVKNHFIKYLKSKTSVDNAGLKWGNMLETIRNSSSAISTDDFIYHFWASRYEAVTKGKLFPKIKAEVTKAKATEYLNSLVSDSKLYRSIHEPGFDWTKNEAEVARSLSALQMFKLSQPTPATLSLVRAYRDQKIKYKKLRDALSAIEKFHFVFTAITSSRSSGGISSMYASFAKKLFEAKDSQEAATEITEFVEKLRIKRPSIEEFKVAFKEVIFTNQNSKQKSLVRYILRKFSEFHQLKFTCDFEDLTIEHLHPQSKIDENYWKEDVVGCLGNLVLLDQEMNELLSNKTFSDKKQLLFENGYTLPDYMVCANDWTPDLVYSHAELMAETAYNEIWKI